MAGGRRDGIGKFAVAGEQQQALAVIIEASHGIDALLDAAQQVHHGLAALGIAHRGDAFGGLVERQIDHALGIMQQAAIHFDVIAIQIGLAPELGDRRAINKNAPLQNELLGFAARGHSGAGKNFLQPFFRHFSSRRARRRRAQARVRPRLHRKWPSAAVLRIP